jgi:hypothetical protein
MRRSLLLATVVVVVLAAPRARAADYSVEIVVDDEDDINQLYFDGEITEEERDRLLTLYLSKVDLNRASREELYELPGFTWRMADLVLERRTLPGGIRKIDDLGDLEGMSPGIMEQIRPFVTARSLEERRRLEAETKTGAITRYAARAQEGGQNTWDPAFYERLRARAYDHLGVGLLITVGSEIGDVRSAPSGGGLSAEGYALRGNVPRFYAYWDGPRLFALAGTYRVGYGLRLTLDTSRRLRPQGLYANDELYESNTAGKITPFDGFTGAAVRLKYLPVRHGFFDVSAFGSACLGPLSKDIYSYDLTYNHGDNPFLIDSETGDSISYATLPRVVSEWLAGGNATYNYDRRIGAGVTGYYAGFKLNVDADGLMAAAASKYPESRNGRMCGEPGYWCPFGAVGLNAKAGWGLFDAAAEVAVNDVGKPAVLGVAWIEPTPALQIIPSFRYYSPGYDNPYARGESAADEYLGNRARDELGPRLRANYRPWKWLRLRADVDMWRSQNQAVYDPDTGAVTSMINTPTWAVRGHYRVDVWPTAKEHLAVWFHHHDTDVGKGGRGLSYYASSADQAGGETFYYAIMASTSRLKRFNFAVQFKHIFEDTSTFDNQYDKSWYVFARVRATLWKGSVISARVKYYDQYTDANPARATNRRYCEDEDTAAGSLLGYPVPAACRGESYVDAFIQASQRIGACCQVKLRTELQHFTDKREKWLPLDPADPVPTRNEVLIKGYFAAKF